ncbi:MAG: SMEK domain-containing protein [Cellvibrio sp.]|nr:SMEK domain-containing protein [Cellvibrio sp.]
MESQQYFNTIEEKLSVLATRIEIRGKLNILDLHIHSEQFYLHLLNLIFKWNLESLNAIDQNAEGIDLIDKTNFIVIQVSSTATKQKIELSLSKNLSQYKDYSYKFVSISKDAALLRKQNFLNPHNLAFVPANDIFDIPGLLRVIATMQSGEQKAILDYLNANLKYEVNPQQVESNLSIIIKILAKVDWTISELGIQSIPYDIDKKIVHNGIHQAKVLVNEFKTHFHRLEKIYSSFNEQGANKSYSVLNGIRTIYLSLSSTKSADELFFSIVDKVTIKVISSGVVTGIPEDEIELCVQILVVDAFIRCKIFKNPEEQS